MTRPAASSPAAPSAAPPAAPADAPPAAAATPSSAAAPGRARPARVADAALPRPAQDPSALNPELEAMLARALRRPAGEPSGGEEGGAPAVPPEAQHCALVAIVGRPNVGKSTLLNALVGQKVSITSRKAQTTRHRITGVRTHGAHQFVFVDTPGFQTRHGNALNRALNKTVLGALADVDVVLFVVEAGRFGPADAQVLALLPADKPVLLLANKFDLITRRAELAPWLQQMQAKRDFAQIVPLSARSRKDIQRLLDICAAYLPRQPWFYGPEELTDRSERFLASEIVREKLFRLTGDELPYTSTVVVDRFEEEGGLRRIAATIVVERESHKGMVIGEGGEKLKRIGTEARLELERLLQAKVFLELWVKVRSGWADDEARVRAYGYE